MTVYQHYLSLVKYFDELYYARIEVTANAEEKSVLDLCKILHQVFSMVSFDYPLSKQTSKTLHFLMFYTHLSIKYVVLFPKDSPKEFQGEMQIP